MPITTQGIKYIKIAKVDGNGVNNTINLSQLTQLLLVSPNLSTRLSYDIVSRTEYSTYFLYGILTNPNTASNYSNYNILFNPNIGNIPFVNSDYDVLAGNINLARYNQKYMEVNNADSQIVPVNLQAILSGSATLAKVQDSNYTLYKQIGSRYLGHQLNSPSLNQYGQLVNDERLGILYNDNDPTIPNIAYGKTPNVSNPKIYFVQINYVAGTSPELGDSVSKYVNASIKYIIDENGKRINPINDIDKINLGIIKQSFNTNATLQLSNPQAFGNDMSILNNTFPVFKAGEKVKPIIYTQVNTYDSRGNVGITSSYSSSVTFVQGDIPNASSPDTLNDYRLTTFVPQTGPISISNTGPNVFLKVTNGQITGSLFTSETPFEIKFNSPIFLGTSGSFPTSSTTPTTGSIYNPTGSLGDLEDQGYVLDIESKINIVAIFQSGRNTTYNLNFALQKSIDNGSTWEDLDNYSKFRGENNFLAIPENYGNTNNGLPFFTSFTLKYRETQATTASLYRVAATKLFIKVDGWVADGGILIANGSYFKITQFPSPSTGQVTRFWFTDKVSGLSISNLLYAAKGAPPLTSSLTAFITPFHSTASSIGSASFSINGANIILTGSNKLPNSFNLMYVSTGSAAGNTAANIATNINVSSSNSNFLTLSDISASNNSANLNLFSKSTGIGGNQYFFRYTGSSVSTGNQIIITSYFEGGEDLSMGLNDVWGQKQVNIEKSGFDYISNDFEPQEGDEIRFNGTEQQTYIITGVTQSLKTQKGLSGLQPTYTLILDRRISPSVNTDYFLLRRYFEDPSNIILAANKPAGSTSPGTLKPEYVTQPLEKIIGETLSELITTQPQ